MENTKLEELAKLFASKIASKHFEHTLETRNSDWLDFFEVAVWTLEDALVEAFNMWYVERMKEEFPQPQKDNGTTRQDSY